MKQARQPLPKRGLGAVYSSVALIVGLAAHAACTPERKPPENPAELILTHGRVYTFAWDDPAPAAHRPRTRRTTNPDGSQARKP